MDIATLIVKARGERTLNKAAKDWGVPQSTLHEYSTGKRVPDYQTAVMVASDAGIGLEEMMRICVQAEASLKPRASFVKKFLTRATLPQNEKGAAEEGSLYVMLS